MLLLEVLAQECPTEDEAEKKAAPEFDLRKYSVFMASSGKAMTAAVVVGHLQQDKQ